MKENDHERGHRRTEHLRLRSRSQDPLGHQDLAGRVQGDATYKFEPDPASKIKEKDAAKFYLQVATAIGTSYNGANAFPPVGTTVTTRLAGDVRLDAY